jgi:hypothetical protein
VISSRRQDKSFNTISKSNVLFWFFCLWCKNLRESRNLDSSIEQWTSNPKIYGSNASQGNIEPTLALTRKRKSPVRTLSVKWIDGFSIGAHPARIYCIFTANKVSSQWKTPWRSCPIHDVHRYKLHVHAHIRALHAHTKYMYTCVYSCMKYIIFHAFFRCVIELAWSTILYWYLLKYGWTRWQLD